MLNSFRYGVSTATVTYNASNGGFPFSFTIPQAADNVAPTGVRYVAKYGNDTAGNGSRRSPYITLQRALEDSPSIVIVGTGEYVEGGLTSALTSITLIGDGYVVYNGGNIYRHLLNITPAANATYQNVFTVSGITFTNYLVNALGANNTTATNKAFVLYRCTFANMMYPYTSLTGVTADENVFESLSSSLCNTTLLQECVFQDISGYVHISIMSVSGGITIAANSKRAINNTFYNCAKVKIREQDVNVVCDNLYALSFIQVEGTYFSSNNGFFLCRFRRRPIGLNTGLFTGNIETSSALRLDQGYYIDPAAFRASYVAWGNYIAPVSNLTSNTANATVTITANANAPAVQVGWRLYNSAAAYIGQVQAVTGTPASGQTVTLTANALVTQSAAAWYYSVPNQNAAQNPLPFNSATTPQGNPRFPFFNTPVQEGQNLSAGHVHLVTAGSVVWAGTTYNAGDRFTVPLEGPLSFTGTGQVTPLERYRNYAVQAGSGYVFASTDRRMIGARGVYDTAPEIASEDGLNTVDYTTQGLVSQRFVPGSALLATGVGKGFIQSPVLFLGSLRTLDRVSMLGSINLRAGDTFIDRPIISSYTIFSGQLLTGVTYYVESGAIVYDFGGSVGVRTLVAGRLFTASTSQIYTGAGVVKQVIISPDRLVFEARYSTVRFDKDASSTDTSLTSFSAQAQSNWKLFLWAEEMRVDAAGRGNGSALFDRSSPLPILTKYVQFRVYIDRSKPPV